MNIFVVDCNFIHSIEYQIFVTQFKKRIALIVKNISTYTFNLMLISQSHNSSIGNGPFSKKLESYISNPLLCQQKRISDFVEDKSNPKWDATSIKQCHSAIVSFAKDRWDFTKE